MILLYLLHSYLSFCLFFFPNEDPIVSLISGYLFVAAGFFTRPLGAWLFGYLGDKYGRKQALIFSLMLMILPTLTIGLMPDYAVAGTWAAIFIFMARCIQGICAGGEYAGAGLYITENIEQRYRFQKGALLTASGIAGLGFSSFIAGICSLPGMPSYAWRVAFLMGTLIGLSALYLRFKLPETQDYKAVEHHQEISFWELFTNYRAPLLCCIGFAALMNVSFYMVIGFINTYFAVVGQFPKHELMFLTCFTALLTATLMIFSGRFVQSLNPERMMLAASAFIAAYALPLFWLAQTKSLVVFSLCQFVLIFFLQFYSAPSLTYMAHLFPVKVRYKGVALGVTLGIAIFAGFTPYISAWLIKLTGSKLSPGFYLMSMGILGWISIRKARTLPKYEQKQKIIMEAA